MPQIYKKAQSTKGSLLTSMKKVLTTTFCLITFITGVLHFSHFRDRTRTRVDPDGIICIASYEKGRLVKAVKKFPDGHINEAYLNDPNRPDYITKFVFRYKGRVSELIKGVNIDVVKGNIKLDDSLPFDKEHGGFIRIYHYNTKSIERYYLPDGIKIREKQIFRDGKILEKRFMEKSVFSLTILPNGEFIEEEDCFNTGIKRAIAGGETNGKVETTTYEDGSMTKLWFKADKLVKRSWISSDGCVTDEVCR